MLLEAIRLLRKEEPEAIVFGVLAWASALALLLL